ncbi:phage tail protein X [Ancylobacter sp. 3268]|uniref:tail protein X n=1 Tax=Ancylobacter sp. 3268 TaxID=2817752 RepID=UPI00285A6ACE|nr:tail protein X [Ancylobacter sp. 3268]MDR6954112.1 phage tail protein X [Ancylobacter sp. 3268]
MDRVVTRADGTTVYVTVDNEMIDSIAERYYGTHGTNTEAILEANPGLADLGPALAAGIAIVLPTVSTPSAVPTFRQLWD